MRRFEFVDGSSSKFWQIEQEGEKLTICWGKIGTAGQTQVKDFPTEAKARAEHDKLVAEKTKKGYVEASAAAVTPAPAPAAKPKKTATATASATATAAATAAATATAPAPATAPATAPASATASASAPRGAEPQFDRSKLDPDMLNVTHRKGRKRPSAEQLAADPWQALQAAWSEWRIFVPWDKLSIPAELRPAAEEARVWLDGTTPGPLSPLAAAVVDALLYQSIHTDSYPVTRALAEASFAKYGAGWLVDTTLAGTRVAVEPHHYRLKEDKLNAFEGFSHYPEHVGPLETGSSLARRLAYFTQSLSDADYAALCAAVEARWPVLSYFQKLLVLYLVADYTPLADALGEEWLACDGMVAGYQKPSWDKYGIKPELWFKYSPPMLLALAKKAVGQSFSNHYLHTYIRDQLDLQGADAIPFLKLHCDTVDYDSAIVEGLELAALVEGPETAALMASHVAGKKGIGKFATEWLEAHPALAITPLADAIAFGSKGADRASAVLFKLDRENPGLADRTELRPAARSALEKLRAKMADRPDASPDELPSVLANPPWLALTRKAPLPVVANVKTRDFKEVLHDDNRVLKQTEADHASGQRHPTSYDAATQQLSSRWSAKNTSHHLNSMKKADVKRAFEEWPPEAWAGGYNIATPLALFGIDAIPGYLRIATANSALFADVLGRYVESPKLAPFFAYARTLKSARKAAERWMLKFPEAACVGLVPLAVGAHTQARRQAESALRFLVAKGQGAVVREVAASYGPEVAQAVEAVLAADPRDQLPNKMPKLPDWCNVAALPRPLLKNREKALPKSAVEAIFMMLAISTPENSYAGLEDVLAVCDRASLEEFSWALFNEWQAAGGSSKEAFGMQQLGILGGDLVARKLTPLIRSWPGEQLQARAVAGLDVLARIGTDLALMHLNGIAQKVKFKGLQEKAREKMDEVAQNRGLSADELADRLVPDLDLDPDGSRTLDFGPRQFRVSFDEALKPFVKDLSGKVIGDLPKPNKSDDAAKAKEADAAWKLLKKDAKAIAQYQIVRLELAMCSLRRWENDSFVALFLEHPLLVHLTRRLVWGVYTEEGKRIGAFRVAEDNSLSDAEDSTYTVPENAFVGIVHPLELEESEKAAFGQILGDYGIVQPFPQIGRDTYAPTDVERKAHVLTRREKQVVPVGKLLGLVERGWRKGQPEDAGWIWDMWKPLPGGLQASLDLHTGIAADMQMTEAKQELGSVVVTGPDPLGDLPPVVFSELVRDLVQLGSAT